MRALASHQCVRGSIPGPGVICRLSLLLVLYSGLTGFPPGTPVYPSPQNQHFQIPIRSWNARAFLNESLWTPCCSMGKQIDYKVDPRNQEVRGIRSVECLKIRKTIQFPLSVVVFCP